VKGERIAHYEILAKLGEGGMGVVYQARDTHLDRFVAVKILPAEKVANPDRKARFVQEAKSASALNHPNIVHIYDIDQRDGIDFMAMEFVAGKTLEELIPRKGMRLNEALKVAVQIADALSAAHEAGIIHRDVKPGNIMVGDDGRGRVLDFGLAKLTELVPESDETRTMVAGERPKTEEGTILGTASYMSPEQAEGKKLDARSDIFSFGSVLYEMLTGRRPFVDDSSMSTLAAIIKEDPKPVREVAEEVPGELERIIRRCLRKEPTRRFQHMDDVKVALEELKEESDSGTLASRPEMPPGPAHRVSLFRLAVFGVAIVAVAAAGWYWLGGTGGTEPLPPFDETILTTFSGSELSPTFSPDGKQVAFSRGGEADQNHDIWVQLVSGGSALQLTSHPADERNPVWSPDGSRIAFVRQGQGVYLISPLGGSERRLLQSNAGSLLRLTGLAWTPDSESLAVVRPSSGIVIVEVATGESRSVTLTPAESLGDFSPAFSPDRKFLAFVRWTTTSSADLYVAPVENGEPTQLTDDSRRIYGVSWTADGKDLVFASNRDGSFRLWRISATSSPGTEPVRVPGASAGAIQPTISKGPPQRLAYSLVVDDVNIWESRPGSNSQLIASTRADHSPQFSPDETRIVFASDRGGFTDIWVCDSDVSETVQLTAFDGNYSGTPRWSPDGSRIVFDSLRRGNRDIHMVDSHGGGPVRLTVEPSEEWRPSYSSDGDSIYFGSDRSGSPQVWKMPAKEGAAEQVTRQGGYEAFESLDGRFVYYTKDRFGTELWRVPVGGGEEEFVAQPVWTGGWAVTEKGILFGDYSRPEDSQVPVKLWNPRSGQVEQMRTLEHARVYGAPGFCATRDGNRILYARRVRYGADLMLVENFR
jgi:eukaryotic-like serine/threonine-protein kinase